MKTQILKTAILIAVGASLSACGDGSKGKSKVQSGLNAKAQDEKEFTGEPGTAEEMANQTYRLKTDRQEFVLKKLAHLVWAKFECKAEMVEGDQTTQGQVTVSFYPTFDIKNTTDGKERIVVSAEEACGRKLMTEPNAVMPTGILLKDENNKYNLQYGLPGTEAPIVTMTWDAANEAPGEISCTTEDGTTAKALLTECTIIPVVTEPIPEIQE